MLIRMECGLNITEKILKFDGRPFFYDELLTLLREKLESHEQHRRTAARTQLLVNLCDPM